MTIATIASTWAGRRCDERQEEFRRPREDQRLVAAGQGCAAPADVPAPQGLQVLLGQDRRHQLQGRQAPDAVRAGAGEDSAAADLRDVRDAPAEAAYGADARAAAGADSLHVRVVGGGPASFAARLRRATP